jgi:hypothetical protein
MASMLAPASKFSKMTETGMRVPRSCAYQKPDSRPSAKYSRRSLWPRLERCRTRS